MDEEHAKQEGYRTTLGTEASSSEFEVTFQEYGTHGGIKYGCVSIDPVDECEQSNEDTPKTVHVTYTEDAELKNNLKYTTIAVNEYSSKVTDPRAVSKFVTLQDDRENISNSPDGQNNSGHSSAAPSKMEGVFSSDPDALKLMQSAPICDRQEQTAFEEDECPQGIFASDPEALKFLKFAPASKKPETQAANASPSNFYASDEPEDSAEIFASDPETLELVKLMQKPNGKLKEKPQAVAVSADEQEDDESQFFVSDPEAMKFIKLMPKSQPPEASQHSRNGTGQMESCSSAETDNCIFASDQEALKFVKLMPLSQGQQEDRHRQTRPNATSSAKVETGENCQGIFASDPEALKYFQFAKQAPATVPSSVGPSAAQNTGHVAASVVDNSSKLTEVAAEELRAQGGDGELIASTKITLKDDKPYTVQVSGEQLDNGLHKKVIVVSGESGQAASLVDIDKLEVSIEEKTNADGTIEKFVTIE